MTSRGWDVLAWSHRYLPSPSNPREPLVLSDEQARFVVTFYEVDAKGEYVYRRAAIEAAKGWGKSPLGAVLALAEFAGPVAPAQPWVQLAATAEDQAVSNCYSLLWALLSENDGKAARELGVDLGRERLYLKSNPAAKLEPVSSSWGAREGQRLTFGLLDETQRFLKTNGGQRLARTLRRNAAKVGGRTLELANAPEIGEGSVAEQTEHEYESGHPGILFVARRPSVEPDPEMDDRQLLELLDEVYEGAPWVDTGRILQEVRDPATPWTEAARFFFNLPSSGVLAAVSSVAWTERQAERELKDGERIALGFDGSHSQDGTALIGCTEDGHLFPIAILERPVGAPDNWRIDRAAVHRALEETFDRYDVGLVLADPWTWQSEVAEWATRWGEEIVLEFPTNTRRMAPAVDRFRTGITEAQLTHAGDGTLTRHVLNARLRPAGRDVDGRGLYTLEKPGPGRLIDAAVASVLAFEAASTMPAAEPEPFFAVEFM